MGSREEKPTVELVETNEMYTVELCDPVKQQINKIELCKPSIVVKPCSPIEKLHCIPDFMHCIPDLWCSPKIYCSPTTTPCKPVYPCAPMISGKCGPWVVEIPREQYEDLVNKVGKLEKEVQELRKRVK
jgi:hypothetical protein